MSERMSGLSEGERESISIALLCRGNVYQAVEAILDAREAAWRGEVDGLRARVEALLDGALMVPQAQVRRALEPAPDATTSPSAASEASGGVDGPASDDERFLASLQRTYGRKPDDKRDPGTDWPTSGSGK